MESLWDDFLNFAFYNLIFEFTYESRGTRNE